jgi:hypothetical protein
MKTSVEKEFAGITISTASLLGVAWVFVDMWFVVSQIFVILGLAMFLIGIVSWMPQSLRLDSVTVARGDFRVYSQNFWVNKYWITHEKYMLALRFRSVLFWLICSTVIFFSVQLLSNWIVFAPAASAVVFLLLTCTVVMLVAWVVSRVRFKRVVLRLRDY